MMDIRRAYEEAKSLPDEVLQKELDSPTGMIPGYIALGELQERKSIRQTTPPQGYSEGGMIARINPFIAYIEAMQNPEQGNMGEAELMERGFKGMTPMMPPQAPAAPQAPMSNNMLVPIAPGEPEKPFHYAKGGPVYYNMNQMEAYIRQRAAAMGIDPNIAVKVARSEGLAPGIWQSNYKKNGVREPSYGPFQLLKGGQGTGFGTGMGNNFQRQTGLDPADPKNVYKTVDYALEQARRGGWSPWYGAKRVGVSRWQGINNKAPIQQTAPVQRAVTPSSPRPSGLNTYATSVGAGTGNAPSKPVTAGTTAATIPQFAAARQAAAQAAASNAGLFRNPMAAAAPTGINMPVAKPASNPFGGLMSLMMMAQMQQEPQQVVVKDDSEFGVNKQQMLPSNPVAELNAVRQTQPVNNRRRRAFI